MKSTSPCQELLLPHRAVYRVASNAAFEVACREGALWITLDNDPRDIVIEAGQCFTTPVNGQALLYALQPSRLTLTPAPAVSPAAQQRATRGVRPMPVPCSPQRSAPGMALAR